MKHVNAGRLERKDTGQQKSWKLPCPIGQTISAHWGFEMVKWLKMSHYSIFCHITPPFWLSWRDPCYQHLNPELWFQRAGGQHLKQQQSRSGETLYFKYFPINCFVWNTETWTLAFTLFLFPYLHKKYSLVNFTSGWKHPQQGKGFITLWKVMGGGREADRKGEWNNPVTFCITSVELKLTFNVSQRQMR